MNELGLNLIAVVLLIVIGLYTLMASQNMLRMLIGFEVMAKGVTLAFITAGAANGKVALGQALAITVIVIEVVFVAIAVAIVMLAAKKFKGLNVRKLTNLKG